MGKLYSVQTPVGLWIAALMALLLSACASPLSNHSEPPSYALSPAPDSVAWNALRHNLPAVQPKSWFSVLDTGQESLHRRLALIDSAAASIDAQYFLWLEDAVGSLLFERLLLAADKGVRVRLLVDDSFLAGEDSVLLAIDEHPNISVRIFNPFSKRTASMSIRYVENLNDFSRTNHRMHNKLLIADTSVAVVGGRNIANEYFGFGRPMNFRDFDLVTTGSIVPALADGFDTFWNSGWAFPIPEVDHQYADDTDLIRLRQDLRALASELDAWQIATGSQPGDWSENWAELAAGMIPGSAILLQDEPHFEEQLPTQVVEQIHRAFHETEEELLSMSAYLVATDELLQGVQRLSSKGVKVSFLTNSLASNNHVAAHSAYRHHRKPLLEAGAELFVMRPDGKDRTLYEAPGFEAEQFGLHGKVIVLDSDRVFIGTMNLDPRSMFLNTEMGLMIDSPQLNARVRKALAPNFSLDNSWQLRLNQAGQIRWHSHDGVLDRQPAGGGTRRVKDFFIGLLPIDSEM